MQDAHNTPNIDAPPIVGAKRRFAQHHPSSSSSSSSRRVRWHGDSTAIGGDAARTPSRVAASSIAEARLRDFLVSSVPVESARHLTVLVPLFGAVPLGQVLADLGFHEVESVTFVPGGITRLLGVPATVMRLECPHNSLTAASLADLGPELRVLIAPYNRVAGAVVVAHLTSLRHLDLGHNAVERFAKVGGGGEEEGGGGGGYAMPNSLNRLVVSHNRLRVLNLRSCPGLHQLDARYNPAPFSVVHASTETLLQLPEGAKVEFAAAVVAPAAAMDGSSLGPGVTYSHSITTKGGGRAAATATAAVFLEPMRLPPEYTASVQTYFTEKKSYIDSTIKQRAAGGPPVCTHCEKPGGMLFSGRNQKYTARCAATEKSCGFTLTVNRGNFVSLRAHATQLRDRVLAARESMIKLQYDALLGYLPQAAVDRQFPSQVARYNGLFEQFQEFERRADEYYFSTAKAERRAEQRRQIAPLLEQVRKLVADRTNPEWAVSAARVQCKNILPLSEKMGKETYPGRGFDRDDTDKTVGTVLVVYADATIRDKAQYNIGAPLI